MTAAPKNMGSFVGPGIAAVKFRYRLGDFKNLDKKNLRILKSHSNRLGVYRILTHMHRIQKISKIIFIPNLDFRISSKRDLVPLVLFSHFTVLRKGLKPF
jgi:hypothetical protein